MARGNGSRTPQKSRGDFRFFLVGASLDAVPLNFAVGSICDPLTIFIAPLESIGAPLYPLNGLFSTFFSIEERLNFSLIEIQILSFNGTNGAVIDFNGTLMEFNGTNGADSDSISFS